jgi:hypothetical protein
MTAKQSTSPPGVEALEDRCVPTTAKLSGGVLSILAKPGADAILVSLAGPKITVSGVRQTFRAGAVHEIVVNTQGGNDAIALDPRLRTPALILCGWGNTTVFGDAGHVTVLGSGHEVFYGRGGSGSVNGVPQSGFGLTPTPGGGGPLVFPAINLSAADDTSAYVDQIYQEQKQLDNYLSSIYNDGYICNEYGNG